MAKLITSLSSCSDRMTPGERRTAHRFENLLKNDVLIWYDTPVGGKYLHPDFVVVDPGRGIVILEVKDWKATTIKNITHSHVTLDVSEGEKQVENPLEQARNYANEVAKILRNEPSLQQLSGKYKGNLNVAWSYGVVFPNISRRQLKQLSTEIEAILPESLTICQDEMTESVSSSEFEAKMAGLFVSKFLTPLSKLTRDTIRRKLYPEIAIKGNSLMHKVMDEHQEILARNLGEGHRVIHGVAGSGKTLIMLYRCHVLAEQSKKPILMMCYNITLANYLREYVNFHGLSHSVHVYHFHAWCAEMVRKFKLQTDNGGEFWENSVNALEKAIQEGKVDTSHYDAVLIDEGHDFESRWLAMIAELFPNHSHSLLMMYDDAQSLYRRERALNFSLASVGIQAVGRTSILKFNYRNPQRVLDFAYKFSKEYFDKHHNKEIPFVHPEACGDEGTDPMILACHNAENEARTVLDWIINQYAQTQSWGEIAILCPTKICPEKLIERLNQHGIPFSQCFSSQEKKAYTHKEDKIHLLTLLSSKGLQFKSVAVINASFIHHQVEDESECIPALYVGFTRTTERLLVTYYKKNSISAHLDDFAKIL